MNNFDAVFTAIKEDCTEADVPNETCYSRLCSCLKDNQSYISVDTYLEVLQGLGLVTFSKATKRITLTPKGKLTTSLFELHEHAA